MDNNKNLNIGKGPGNVGGDDTQKETGATVIESQAAKEAELNSPYTDKRTVTIAPVQQFSAYRRANIKSMPPRRNIIGSSISSTRILSSNKDEVEKYFPQIIGISPNNPEFVTRVKAYLSNISFNVQDAGSTLNISFTYDKKKDYLAIKEKEEKINAKRESVARNNTAAIKEAVKVWTQEINDLESEKAKYGHPDNIEEYLLYRHCILYRDVAKDISLINSDSSLRFYIRDENKEAERAKRLVDERRKAMRNFLALESSDKKRNAVFIQMTVNNGGNIAEAMLKTSDQQVSALMTYLNDSPDKFNDLFEDKNVEMKSFIESLIARGELIRPEYNQQISTADGTFIGSNMNEAVAYFNNPTNKPVLEAMQNKYKLF